MTAGAAVAPLPAAASATTTARTVPATATATATASDSAIPPGRLIIGDSLSLSMTTRLEAQDFTVHAKVGRQFRTAPGIVRSFGARLPRNVVIELGTNGTLRMSDCRAVVRAAGPGRVVFLVTNRVPRPWQAANNRTLHACNRAYRTDRVRIVNWYRASAGHPEWFVRDRVHLTAAGRRELAARIDARVDKYGKR